MRFFSGFGFKNEQKLFDEFLVKNDFTVAGFSYGAIKAFEKVYNSSSRIDLLQLFSPAFFQDRDDRFKKMQITSFKKNNDKYMDNFYKNVTYPSTKLLEIYKKSPDIEDLKKLLYYCWDDKKLELLLKRGVKIEVYLGENDKIINTKQTLDFFKNFTTVYFLNKKGHIL